MRYTLIFLVLAFACTKRSVTTNTSVTDSTIIKEVVRFDTIRVDGDTVVLTRVIECDPVTDKPKPFKASKRSGRVSARVSVSSNGTLSVESVCDSLERVIKVMDKEIFRLRTEKSKTIVKVEPSQFKIWFDWTCRILAGLLVLYIIFMVFRSRSIT